MDEGIKNFPVQKQIQEKGESTVAEFPTLTPKDLEQIHDLKLHIWRKFEVASNLDESLILPGFRKYTGIEKDVGISNIYNSVITAEQLRFALAMTRHPLLYKTLQDPSVNRNNFSAEELVKNKIMQGIKILDLGSSSMPVFARCCRYMGANVWTVDLKTINENNSNISAQLLSPEVKELEIRQHISLNLSDKNAIGIITKLTGGNFNFITESHLESDGFHGGEDIALALLKKGGVYFNPPDKPELKT